MPITITRTLIPSGTTSTLTPFMVLGYNFSRPSSNVVHDLIGVAAPDITIGPPRTREGSLALLARSASEASTYEAFHLSPASFAFVDTAQTYGNVNYVLAAGGSVRLEQHEDRKFWTVTIDVKAIS